MYKYRQIEEAQPGDIVEFVDNSGYTRNPVGTLHIIGKMLKDSTQLYDLTPPLKDMTTPQQKRFKLLETKPGSEAQVGDTVIRINGGTDRMPTGATFEVLKADPRRLHYEESRSAIRSECLVLCKADDTLLHQHWKNLYDQGVELEWTRNDYMTYGTRHEKWYEAKPNSFNLYDELCFNGEGFTYRIKQQQKHELAMAQQRPQGWYVVATNSNGLLYLRKDLSVQEYVAFGTDNSGYWSTEAEANLARAQYLGEQMVPEIKVGSHWERISQKMYLDNIVLINDVSDSRVYWYDHNKSLTVSEFLQKFKPRPDLDQPTARSNAEPQSTTKEQPMNKLDLRLLTAIMAALSSEEVAQDATNSEFLCVMTKDNNYEGYFYSKSVEDYTKVMQKQENCEKKLHVFKYQSTIAQKPAKIVEVERV